MENKQKFWKFLNKITLPWTKLKKNITGHYFKFCTNSYCFINDQKICSQPCPQVVNQKCSISSTCKLTVFCINGFVKFTPKITKTILIKFCSYFLARFFYLKYLSSIIFQLRTFTFCLIKITVQKKLFTTVIYSKKNSYTVVICRDDILQDLATLPFVIRAFALTIPLLLWPLGHISQDYCLGSLPPLYFRICRTRTDWFIDVYVKSSFGAKIYLYILQISRV